MIVLIIAFIFALFSLGFFIDGAIVTEQSIFTYISFYTECPVELILCTVLILCGIISILIECKKRDEEEK